MTQIIFKCRDWIELATIMSKEEFKNILWSEQGENGSLTVGVKYGQ